MIKATIGLVIVIAFVAFWLARGTFRFGREVYDSAIQGGMAPAFGKAMVLRGQATAMVQKLLAHASPLFGSTVDVGNTATRLVQALYETHPAYFNGHYRQDPHPLSLAAAALALEISSSRQGASSRCAFPLLMVMQELEKRGELYAFNTLDARLLDDAAKVALQIGEEAERKVDALGIRSWLDSEVPVRPAATPPPAAPPAAARVVPRDTPPSPLPASDDGSWGVGLVFIAVVVGAVGLAVMSSVRSRSENPLPMDYSPVVAKAPAAPKPLEEPQPAAAPLPPREFPALPGLRVLMPGEPHMDDLTSERVDGAGPPVSRAATVLTVRGETYIAEFYARSEPGRFIPAFRLREAVQRIDVALPKALLEPTWTIAEPTIDGDNVSYHVLASPTCKATLRVASNRLVEFRLCGPEPHDDPTFKLISDSLADLNPSKDVEPDSPEDALTMTFRAIRDQLSEGDRAAFIAEQRAWDRSKEEACVRHTLLTEGFFRCIDAQVASRLALLRARVATASEAGQLPTVPAAQAEALRVLAPASSSQ